MPLEHVSYPKIATSRPDSTVGGEWIATEKIHGANFVVGTDGTEARFGKRKAWLDEDEAFFGWQLLRTELGAAARRLHASLSDAPVLWVFGELFGGCYPHPDVPAVPGLRAVQTGVWYSPRLEFAAFDVLVGRPAGPTFLGTDRAYASLEQAGFQTAPILARGPLAALSTLQVRRPSQLPSKRGLPPLPDNVAEGHVLKPASSMAADRRPVLKRKIDTFDDRAFGEAVAFDPNAHLSLTELRSLCGQMVNVARWMSARSKVGEAAERILDEIVIDVLVDLEAILPRRFALLSEPELGALQDHVRRLAEPLSVSNVRRAPRDR